MNHNRYNLLAIDDDELILQSLRIALPEKWKLTGLTNLKDFYKTVENSTFDAAIIDMHLSGDLNIHDGMDVIKNLSHQFSQLEIIAMSGDLNRSNMESAIDAGARRFLAKPLRSEELQLTLSKVEALVEFNQSIANKKVMWIGQSDFSNNLYRQISHLKNEMSPVLIEGPSGTGKEVVAHMIHQQENNQYRPFVSVNVAAIPENLFESELFGYVKGAFTGADKTTAGLIEKASEGDLFLDEIEVLHPAHQAKLLRFLESGEVRKVGSSEIQNIQCRVIAATNESLEEMVQEKRFREDLLWRINGNKINISPLRERTKEIPLLAQYFSDKQKPRYNKSWSKEAFDALCQHSWPGNVRELKRVVERICMRSPLPIIRAEDVWASLNPQSYVAPAAAANLKQSEQEIDLNKGLSQLMGEHEAEILSFALKKSADIDATAKLLGISRSNLYKKIKDYQLEL